MAKVDPETSALKHQLADALAQMDSLQAAVADAEARAATGRDRLASLPGGLETVRGAKRRTGGGAGGGPRGPPRAAESPGAPLAAPRVGAHGRAPLRVCLPRLPPCAQRPSC